MEVRDWEKVSKWLRLKNCFRFLEDFCSCFDQQMVSLQDRAFFSRVILGTFNGTTSDTAPPKILDANSAQWTKRTRSQNPTWRLFLVCSAFGHLPDCVGNKFCAKVILRNLLFVPSNYCGSELSSLERSALLSVGRSRGYTLDVYWDRGFLETLLFLTHWHSSTSPCAKYQLIDFYSWRLNL